MIKDTVILRPFTHEDAAVLQGAAYSALALSEIEEMVDEWNGKLHNGKNFEMFAIEADGKIVGDISLYEFSAGKTSEGVRVYEESRGKGYARAAIKLVLDYAKSKGSKKIYAQVRVDNAASVKLHTECGFETEKEFVNSKGNRVYQLCVTL